MFRASRIFTLAVGLAVSATAVQAADCSDKVKEAFAKQREAKMFRMAMSQPTAEGPVTMTVDYILPDRMLQTVVAPHMPGEQQTMLVGNRAFAGSGGGFEELLPQFTQSIVSEFLNATDPNRQTFEGFECAGEDKIDGKDVIAYRVADKSGKEPEKTLGRTIYVDKETGRPVFNVVAALAGNTEPVMKATYTYPTDLEIIAPEGAPIQRRP